MRRKTNSIWNDEQNEITTTLLDVIFKRKKLLSCISVLHFCCCLLPSMSTSVPCDEFQRYLPLYSVFLKKMYEKHYYASSIM